MNHLKEKQVIAYLAGMVSDEELLLVERHCVDCRQCGDQLLHLIRSTMNHDAAADRQRLQELERRIERARLGWLRVALRFALYGLGVIGVTVLWTWMHWLAGWVISLVGMFFLGAYFEAMRAEREAEKRQI